MEPSAASFTTGRAGMEHPNSYGPGLTAAETVVS
jgi:hypothetical protein